MDWITKFWKKPEIKQETVIIDMMKTPTKQDGYGIIQY